jgi:hypothetical protein
MVNNRTIYTGFEFIVGDCSLATINDFSIVKKIILDADNFIQIPLRWAYGNDGWDTSIQELYKGKKSKY